MPCSLSEAIDIVVSDARLSDSQITALESKLGREKAARFTQGIIRKTKDAHAQLVSAKDIKEHNIFQPVADTLKGWDIAWLCRSGARDKNTLSKHQRTFEPYQNTAFDIRTLSEDEKNFLFMLAYAEVHPISYEEFVKIFEACSSCTPAGKDIRRSIQARIYNDRMLSKIFPTEGLPIRIPTKRKRDLTEVGANPPPKKNKKERGTLDNESTSATTQSNTQIPPPPGPSLNAVYSSLDIGNVGHNNIPLPHSGDSNVVENHLLDTSNGPLSSDQNYFDLTEGLLAIDQLWPS